MQASLDKLEAFFKLRLRITDAADEELCELFDLTLQSASIPDADRVCPFELTLLLEAFHEFRQDLRTLQWLERVNTEAVDRILAKLGRRDDADSPSYRSICARWEPLRTGWDRDLALRLSRYDALIADASDGLRDPQRVGRKSLYFLRYLQQCSALRPSVDQYLRTIFSDDSQDASGVIKWQHDADDLLDVSDRQIADLCSEMLRYQVMLRPANTSPSLIPDDVRERMLITDQTLKWGILAMGRRQKLDSSPDTVPHRRHRSQPGLQLQLLRDILQSCREERRPDVLLARDSLGRLPLHHAAIYGVTGHGDSDMDMFVPKDVEVEIRDPADPSSDFEGSRDPDFGLLGLMEIERLTSSEPDLVRKDGKLDAADKRGWNPLFHACALGQYDLVKRLLQLGCSQTATDDLGWTAQEYAVLHGHLAVAALFESGHLLDATKGPARPPAPTVAHPKLHCAEGERIIVASLGTERVDDFVTEVNLSYCSSVYDPRTYSGISYNLEVSAPGSAARPRLVRLPILDDQINDPFVFPIPATVEPQLMFKIIRQGAGADGQDIMVGSGTALLENNTRQLGAGRQSLIREQTIAILDKNTMAAVGTVTFTFMVANHFAHLQTPRQVVARKAGEPPTLIGHRGLGMNLKRHDYLQIGENTVESFLSAVKLGAPFVEFDYQVTKDHEAVIFHDFSLSQSGTDVPLQDVTLDQFMYAGDIQSPHGNPLSVLGPIHSKEHPGVERRRARSVGSHFEAGAVQIRDRMKHTADYKLKGFKPNTRGDFIQDSFATLKELLLQVPEDVGFDIEISSSYQIPKVQNQEALLTDSRARVSPPPRSQRRRRRAGGHRTEHLRRHRAPHNPPARRHPAAHHILLVHARDLHPPLTQAESLPGILHHQRRQGAHGGHGAPGGVGAGGRAVRAALELGGRGVLVRGAAARAAHGGLLEEQGARVRLLRHAQ